MMIEAFNLPNLNFIRGMNPIIGIGYPAGVNFIKCSASWRKRSKSLVQFLVGKNSQKNTYMDIFSDEITKKTRGICTIIVTTTFCYILFTFV